MDWTGTACLKNDVALREFTQRLIALRATQPLLRRESWRDGLEIRWFNAGGGPQQSEQWDEGATLGVAISRPDLQQEGGHLARYPDAL
ncbi:glycogen debranching protein GlgX [Enterobacter cancerogenus]|uniref:Glycogen debranching protein GlgX n=1 Tax=Enterobacter cancerogenus TaxID=69218 RepID=A0A484ZGS4_9ENTR|nr:glycogen debranching protein GlgX [Enterobacter cancerogenus]